MVRDVSDKTLARVLLWDIYVEVIGSYFYETTPPPLLSSSEDEVLLSSSEDEDSD